MAEWQKVTLVAHQVAIAGQVTDARTGKTIAGALVELTAAPAAFTRWLALQKKQYGTQWQAMIERLDRTPTRADGFFHFRDLPVGTYTLKASLPDQGTRYGTAQAAVTVALDASSKPIPVTTALTLVPTTLTGTISVQAGNETLPVFMAQVQVKGSGESTFSDRQGNYWLTGLEIGNRTVQVVFKGYQANPATVALGPAGVEQSLSFTLVPATS